MQNMKKLSEGDYRFLLPHDGDTMEIDLDLNE